jgi:dUTP pyrophosphatase
MQLKIKKLHPNAVLPKRAHSTDAGLDLTATSLEVKDNQAIYGTGIAVDIPEGYVGLLCARGSICKKDLILNNGIGIVDSGFSGEVKAIFNSTNMKSKPIYELGERVCQLVIVPCMLWDVQEVSDLPKSDRGSGSHGSSGA